MGVAVYTAIYNIYTEHKTICFVRSSLDVSYFIYNVNPRDILTLLVSLSYYKNSVSSENISRVKVNASTDTVQKQVRYFIESLFMNAMFKLLLLCLSWWAHWHWQHLEVQYAPWCSAVVHTVSDKLSFERLACVLTHYITLNYYIENQMIFVKQRQLKLKMGNKVKNRTKKIINNNQINVNFE